MFRLLRRPIPKILPSQRLELRGVEKTKKTEHGSSTVLLMPKSTNSSVTVVVRDFELNPSCPHGATVLFSTANGEKYFSCAGIRNRECFYLDFAKFVEGDTEKYSKERKVVAKPLELSYEEVLQSSPDQRIFCKTCGIFVSSLQSHRESHNFLQGIENKTLKEPSLFLPQLDNDKLNAQYLFDDNTLEFIVAMLESLHLYKVVCVGAPRLHDFLSSKKPKMSSLLLDIDTRFQSFNDGIFIHYNMFNNHFFNGPKDEDKLKAFLKDDELIRTRHCIFSDPPFAARTELLDFNFRKFTKLYNEVNSSRKVLPVFLVFPYFNEKHVTKFMPEMEMLDFAVSYVNHKTYRDDFKGRKEGSPVRVFTNVDLGLIKYPKQFDKYRLCRPCNRFVSVNNKHCFICKTCPSKNNATYVHCIACILCVKPNYVHCLNCQRCHTATRVARGASKIDCSEYQKHQECWFCNKKGHVEKYCQLMKKFKRRKDLGFCSLCKDKKKHNLRSCPSKQELL